MRWQWASGLHLVTQVACAAMATPSAIAVTSVCPLMRRLDSAEGPQRRSALDDVIAITTVDDVVACAANQHIIAT